MGRSNRKAVLPADRDGIETGGTRLHWTETHPDRENWEPHELAIARGMSQEAYEAVYGRGGPAAIKESRSQVFPDISTEQQQKLRSGSFTGQEMRQLLLRAVEDAKPEDIASDPVIGALWENELCRLRKEADATDSTHWFEWYDSSSAQEALRATWTGKIIPELLASREVALSASGGVSEKSSAAPHSLLAAALETRGPWRLDESVLGSYLQDLRLQDPEASRKNTTEQILPEAQFLFRESSNRPSTHLLSEYWRGVSLCVFDDEAQRNKTDPLVSARVVLDCLPEEFRDTFATVPVVPDRALAAGSGKDPRVFREAFARIGDWSEMSGQEIAEDMEAVNNKLLGEYLVRIYTGLDVWYPDLQKCRQKEAEQEEAALEQGKKFFGRYKRMPLALDNLYPIFEKEGQEKLFKEISDRYRKHLRRGTNLPLEKILAEETLDSRRLQQKVLGLAPISSQIVYAIEGHLPAPPSAQGLAFP